MFDFSAHKKLQFLRYKNLPYFITYHNADRDNYFTMNVTALDNKGYNFGI